MGTFIRGAGGGRLDNTLKWDVIQICLITCSAHHMSLRNCPAAGSGGMNSYAP
jgi:hypothetical protein